MKAGRWFWGFVALLVVYFLASNVIFMVTLGAYPGTGYDLVLHQDEIEMKRVPVWVEGNPRPDEAHAVAVMGSTFFGLRGSHQFSDQTVVNCRWFLTYTWCDTGWVIEQPPLEN